MFEGIKEIMWFISWLGVAVGMVLGLGIGLVIALGVVPNAYHAFRRRMLHRQWQRDISREVEIGLTPTWTDYDPHVERVDRRCVCHNQRVTPGARVLLWPEVGPFGVLRTTVYCESVKESV